jgi:hypothetical protein
MCYFAAVISQVCFIYIFYFPQPLQTGFGYTPYELWDRFDTLKSKLGLANSTMCVTIKRIYSNIQEGAADGAAIAEYAVLRRILTLAQNIRAPYNSGNNVSKISSNAMCTSSTACSMVVP